MCNTTVVCLYSKQFHDVKEILLCQKHFRWHVTTIKLLIMILCFTVIFSEKNTYCGHFKRLFDLFKYDMKKTWKIISDSLNKTSHNSIPDTMIINGLDCTYKKQIADSFNAFFVSLGEQNNANFERHRESHYRDYLTDQVEAQFTFRSISNSDTVRMIKNVKLSNSKGQIEDLLIY